MNSSVRAVAASAAGAVAGFLTRPCCVFPAALSLAGASSVGLAHIVMAYRPVLLSMSAVVLTTALWLTFRQDGGWLTKAFTAGATLLAFGLSARWMEFL